MFISDLGCSQHPLLSRDTDARQARAISEGETVGPRPSQFCAVECQQKFDCLLKRGDRSDEQSGAAGRGAIGEGANRSGAEVAQHLRGF